MQKRSHSYTGKEDVSKNNDKSTKGNVLNIQMGTRLRKFRREKDFTQEQMAEILGISTAYYGKIERGINSLSIKRLYILNDKLGLDITYLVTGKEDNLISVDQLLFECPIGKRFDLEQLIKHAINLIKDK